MLCLNFISYSGTVLGVREGGGGQGGVRAEGPRLNEAVFQKKQLHAVVGLVGGSGRGQGRLPALALNLQHHVMKFCHGVLL